MNNVIFILIDSVFSKCIGTQRTEESTTPFIDSLVKESLFAPNVYSYGPYTDAATIGLYCGIPTLNRYGYFFGINYKETNHFKLFKENGYETYGFYYPYYLIGSEVKQNIDHVIYTSGFKFGSVWGGKLEYYAKKKEKGSLSEIEYYLLEKCMDLVFDCWGVFYHDIDVKEESTIIIKENSGENISCKDLLKKENDKYKSNKRIYIDTLLKLGMSHPLSKINEYGYENKKFINFYKDIYTKHSRFFKKVSRVNFLRNIFNNPINVKKSVKCILKYLKTLDKSELRYFGNYGMLLFANMIMKKRSLTQESWQDLASLNMQINAMFTAIQSRKSSKKPFYVSLHVLEPHHNVSYFSFDSLDMETVDEEIEYLYPLINKCGKKFKGNLIYQLSLRYVDLCIKRLYERLDKEGLLENTAIVLVSDHGSSYSFLPVRTHVVNTFHKENYNIPFLIYQKSEFVGKGKIFKGLYMSDDVLPTIAHTFGFKKTEGLVGNNICAFPQGRKYIITEYMGPGVPDMLSRDVWMSVRYNNYVVAYKNGLFDSSSFKRPVAIFDLNSDIDEQHNLANSKIIYESDKVKQMESIARLRLTEIKKSLIKFFDDGCNDEKWFTRHI